MTDDTSDHVWRRTILKTSASLAGIGTLGGFGRRGWHSLAGPAVGTAAGATQDTLPVLAALAGNGRLVVVSGTSFVQEPTRFSLMPEATMNPEGLLVFAPERLAEEGRVRLDDLLVVTGIRALEGDRTTAMAGGLFEAGRWFPQDVFDRLGGSESFPTDVFMPEEGVEGGRVIGFRDEEWEPGARLFSEEWFPDDVFEPADVIEAGTAEFETADIWPLFGAAGHHFFPTDTFERVQNNLVPWEELARAETATVLAPDDLR